MYSFMIHENDEIEYLLFLWVIDCKTIIGKNQQKMSTLMSFKLIQYNCNQNQQKKCHSITKNVFSMHSKTQKEKTINLQILCLLLTSFSEYSHSIQTGCFDSSPSSSSSTDFNKSLSFCSSA